MCGIVGYVGSQSALDVVVEGLARLEYRGYDSAGTAVSIGGKLSVTKRAGKLVNLRDALADTLPPGGKGDRGYGGDTPSRSGIGHTRWATHGAAERPQRPPARRLHRLRRRRAQRHHRELRRAPARARTPGPRAELRHRHRGRRPPARGGGGQGRGPGRRDAPGLPCVSTARSRSSRSTPASPTSSSAPAATPLWSSASARVRTSWPATSRPSSRTPATRSSWARTRSWSCARRASPSPASTARRPR